MNHSKSETTNISSKVQSIFGWLQENVASLAGLNKEEEQSVRPSKSEPIEAHIQVGNSIDILLARDISVGGIGVAFPYHFEESPVNHEVDLIIKLPKSRSFHAKGRIKTLTRERKNTDYCEIEFTNLTKAYQELIFLYVLKRFDELGDQGSDKVVSN